MDINYTIVFEEWNEYTMNWTNQPVLSKYSVSDSITGDGYWYVNCTDVIKEGICTNNISICVYTTNPIQDDYFLIDSREEDLGYSWYGEDNPSLFWFYEKPATSSSGGGGGGGGGGGDDDFDILETIPGYDIFIIIGSICGLVVILTKKCKIIKK